MFSVSKLNNFGRQYYYLFNFRGIIGRYIVLSFLPQNRLLRPTNHKIRALVGSQDGAYFHWSVPSSLCYLPTNLYTSVVDFIYVRPPVESALYPNVVCRFCEMAHVVSLILIFMSLGSMSHVDFKKWRCHPVDFRGQGPYTK